MRVGYVRVGSVDQNTVRQFDGVEIERTFSDKALGKDTVRSKPEEMVLFVRDGDTVIVHSMDRLARNLNDLSRTVRTAKTKIVSCNDSKRRGSCRGRGAGCLSDDLSGLSAPQSASGSMGGCSTGKKIGLSRYCARSGVG